jgi:glycosyltransferase involved in cell wall biosynthesis
MRIAITHPYSWPDVRRGAERMVRALAAFLTERGHEVTILSAGTPTGWEEDHGARIHRMARRFDDAARHERAFGLALLPHLARGRFDAVHSFAQRDAVAAIRTARITGHRTVYTNLGLPLRDWWDAQPDGKAHARVVRDIDVYGCMSRFALDCLTREYGREGVLTPGGVDLAQFTPAPAREPTPTVLFSGAITEPRKGVSRLLEAIALLAEDRPDIRLWLSGPGDAAPLLAAAPLAARERTVALPLGQPGEQPARYGRAWVTALPSQWDSFGMAHVESLACGTPIVAGNHAAVPELVDPGVTGALCDPLDTASVAAAIADALDLATREQTVAACRASAAPYDWAGSLVPAFEAMYAGDRGDSSTTII